MTVPLDLGKGVALNIIFSWLFLKTIKSLIMTDKKKLIIGLLGEHLKLNIMVPQRSKEAPKTSEVLSVPLTVAIP